MTNNLQSRRLELGLTQPQVAAALRAVEPRMDIGLYSKMENGYCLPTPLQLERLEATLQAPRTALYSADMLAEVGKLTDADRGTELPEELRQLVNAIPYGQKNAVTRKQLCARLMMPDRMVRKLIERARLWGYIIINDQDGSGYFQTDDLDVMERQYRQDTSRALSIFARRKAIRRRLKDAGREV